MDKVFRGSAEFSEIVRKSLCDHFPKGGYHAFVQFPAGSCEKVQTPAVVPAQSDGHQGPPCAIGRRRLSHITAEISACYHQRNKITLHFTFFLAHLVFFFF